jgi:hypothetical protein
VSAGYEEALKGAVLDGRLDAAESPAAVLNELIGQVSMPGEQVRWTLCFSPSYMHAAPVTSHMAATHLFQGTPSPQNCNTR